MEMNPMMNITYRGDREQTHDKSFLEISHSLPSQIQ